MPLVAWLLLPLLVSLIDKALWPVLQDLADTSNILELTLSKIITGGLGAEFGKGTGAKLNGVVLSVKIY